MGVTGSAYRRLERYYATREPFLCSATHAATPAGAERENQMITREAYNPADHPLETLRLSEARLAEIVAHLRNALPNEGCGLIAVDPVANHDVVAFFPGSNADASPTRFTMDGKEVIDALKAMELHGWRLGAIVHSHPNHPATPSPTDLIEALYPAALMVICSFAEPTPRLRAWAIAGHCDAPASIVGEREIVILP
jgi:proteasome lid subunit RPN8/RPN11